MKKLYKRTRSKVFAGVASGIADYFLIDPVFVRIIFIFGAFFGGTAFFIYLVLMFVLPKDTELLGYAYAVPNPNVNTNTNPNQQNYDESGNYNSNNSNYANSAAYNSQYGNTYGNQYYQNYQYDTNSNESLESNNSGRVIFGIALILIGIVIMANMFIPFFSFDIIFPILLMILGLFIVFGKKLKQK